MSKEDIAYTRSIIKIPVDGPAPNNTLVFIRAWLPVKDRDGVVAPGGFGTFSEGESDAGLLRTRVDFPSLYAIDGFLHADYPDYRDNTKISITAFLSTIDLYDDDDSFVGAVDQVEAVIDRDGKVQVSAWVAEQEGSQLVGDVELSLAVFFSAYILTKEPRPDIPTPRYSRSITDALIGEHVRTGRDTRKST